MLAVALDEFFWRGGGEVDRKQGIEPVRGFTELVQRVPYGGC
jgi:hypothetical protein